jgi:predicted secreted Zn-dependent protease
LGLVLATNAVAEIYKWVDKNGRVHYEGYPPPDANAKPLHVRQSHSANPASGVEVQESSLQYYPVYGNTPYALHSSMLQNGPFNEIVKQRVYAEIHWQLKWKFNYSHEPRKCRIDRFGITLVSTITMPQWMDPDKAPAELKNQWRGVVSKIRKHEDGHKANGIEAANVLARRLKSLPVFDDCQTLTRAVDREGERISNEYALVDRAFDRTEALKGSPFED